MLARMCPCSTLNDATWLHWHVERVLRRGDAGLADIVAAQLDRGSGWPAWRSTPLERREPAGPGRGGQGEQCDKGGAADHITDRSG